jgi:hypothetical protein
MHAHGQVERLWVRRLRWRLRGAVQWPAFALLTVLDAVLLLDLPFYSGGPSNLAGALLLAAFANLLVVAVVGPLLGSRLRRRRPDLPRLVAGDTATALTLAAVTLLFLLGGVVHRPAVAAEQHEAAAVASSTHAYVLADAPEYRSGLSSMDAIQLEEDLYRACVPGADPKRALCLFVKTSQTPPGVTRDPDQAPNSSYRLHAGPR